MHPHPPTTLQDPTRQTTAATESLFVFDVVSISCSKVAAESLHEGLDGSGHARLDDGRVSLWKNQVTTIQRNKSNILDEK